MIVDGLSVSYCYFQGESTECLVFLHGRGRSKEDWNQYFESLKEKKIWCFALDFPGFWKSQIPSEVRGVEEYSDFIVHCLQKLKISTPVSLVCHSFGGRIAFRLASHQEDIIQKLFLCAPWGVEKVISPFRKRILNIGKKLLSFPPFKPLKTYFMKKIGSADYLNNPMMRKVLVKVVNQDLRSYFPEIEQETLLFRWEKDDQIFSWQIEEMKKGIKNLTFYAFPWVSHDVHQEKKEEILQEILK